MAGMPMGSATPSGMGQGSMPGITMAHNGHNDVHATGVVKAIDVDGRKITVSHPPIPQIGWPAMTMEFAVAPAVDLSAIKPNNTVNFSMEQGANGMYVIHSMTPAGGGG